MKFFKMFFGGPYSDLVDMKLSIRNNMDDYEFFFFQVKTKQHRVGSWVDSNSDHPYTVLFIPYSGKYCGRFIRCFMS